MKGCSSGVSEFSLWDHGEIVGLLLKKRYEINLKQSTGY